MNNQMTAITPKIYEPTLDPDSGLLKDNEPWPRGQRNRVTFICPCNNSRWSMRQNFETHKKTNCHQRWLLKRNEEHNATRRDTDESVCQILKLNQQVTRLKQIIKERDIIMEKQEQELFQNKKRIAEADEFGYDYDNWIDLRPNKRPRPSSYVD